MKVRLKLRTRQESYYNHKKSERTNLIISVLTMSTVDTEKVERKQENTSELRIMLVGNNGVGKSASGNTILRKEAFKSDLSCSPVTLDCVKVKAKIKGRTIAVIDTPVLFDSTFRNHEVAENIKRCISLCAPGPHVFLVVLQLGRFTKEEKDTVEIIKKLFGEDSLQYIMVLFTHGDKLEKSKKTIDEFVHESPDLEKFVQTTSGRYCVFNNEVEDSIQVQGLLKHVDQLIMINGGNHYTNEMFQMAEIAIHEEKLRIATETPMDEEQARKKAESSNNFLKTARFVQPINFCPVL